jgi:hypothetical protein
MAADTANPPRPPSGLTIAAVRRAGLWVALVLDRATNIDEVIGNHPKSDPAFSCRRRPDIGSG